MHPNHQAGSRLPRDLLTHRLLLREGEEVLPVHFNLRYQERGAENLPVVGLQIPGVVRMIFGNWRMSECRNV